MKSSSTISVLMAVYNGDDYLQEALDSLAGQTCKDFRLVVVDDCSTDRTAKILGSENRFEILRLRNEKNLGLTKSLNAGLQDCDSDWIMRMDADDICVPERVAVQRSFFRQNPDLSLFSSDMLMVDSENRPIGKFCFPSEDGRIRFDFLFANPFGHPTACFRRDALLRAGGSYDARFITCQDYELWGRLLDQGLVANQREMLVRYRRHGGTVESLKKIEQRATAEKLRIAYVRKMAETVSGGDQDTVEAFVTFMNGTCVPGEKGIRTARTGFEILTTLAEKWLVPLDSPQFCRRWKLICRSQVMWDKMCRIRASSWLGPSTFIKTWASERWGPGSSNACSIGWPFRGD